MHARTHARTHACMHRYNPILAVQLHPEGLVTVLRIIEREEAREAQGGKSATTLTRLKSMYYENVEKAIQHRWVLNGARSSLPVPQFPVVTRAPNCHLLLIAFLRCLHPGLTTESAPASR